MVAEIPVINVCSIVLLARFSAISTDTLNYSVTYGEYFSAAL